MSTPAPRPYEPPVDDDEPLDRIEQVLVQLWINVIAAELRAELADEQRREAADDRPVAATGDLERPGS